MSTESSEQSAGHSVNAEISLEVKMSVETAQEMEKEHPKCGRLVFRGVELAYLNIDGEYMLPLAELLALVLPSTPRTTLFTRMEKMKVRRHFCQPEEIKLLKTVNGIHGSSANCTLLSKTEIDKYCAIYIDSLAEQSNKEIRSEGIASASRNTREESKAVNCKERLNMQSAYANDNEIPKKLTVPQKHKKSSPLKATHKLAKTSNSVKLKSALSPASSYNQTLTDKGIRAAIEQPCVSVKEYDRSFLPVSSESLSSGNASNYSQTQPLLDNNKRLKKRDKNLNSALNRKGKSSRDNEVKQEFEAPLKIPKRSATYGHRQPTHTSSEFQSACKLQSSQKNDGDALVSDCSSNDSGFASTALSNPSTPTKTDFSAVELNGLLRKDEEAIREHAHSVLRPAPKLKTPTKNRIGKSDGKSLTLSPPALVLKRYEDSWQVEQKSPCKEIKCLHKSKVKSKKKARQVGLSSYFDVTCGQALTHSARKLVKKKRKRKKPLNFKQETLITKDFIIGEKPEVSGSNTKTKRKKKDKINREGNSLNVKAHGDAGKNSDVSTVKARKTDALTKDEQVSKKYQTAEELSKNSLVGEEGVLDRLVGDALAKFFRPRTSTIAHSPSVLDDAAAAGPKPKKRKVVGPKKPVLKTNSSFKLLNLFPITSQLSIEDGILCPIFTMSCPEGARPPSPHPLWKWRLGGPIVRDSAPQFVKPRLPPKPKKRQSDCAMTMVSSKVRKLKRKRRKRLSANEVNKAALSMTVSTNGDVSDSIANQNICSGLGESTLSACYETSLHFPSSPSVKIAVN